MKKIFCVAIILFITTIIFAQREMGYIVDTRGDTIVGLVKLKTDTIDFKYMMPQYNVRGAKRNFAYSDLVDYGYYRVNDFDDMYSGLIQLRNQVNTKAFYISAKRKNAPPISKMPIPCDLILAAGDTLKNCYYIRRNAEKSIVEFYSNDLKKMKFNAKKKTLKEFILHRGADKFHVDLIFLKGNETKGEWQPGYAGRTINGEIRVYNTSTIIDFSPLEGTEADNPIVNILASGLSIENTEDGVSKRIIIKGDKTYRFNKSSEWEALFDKIFATELEEFKAYLEQENIDIEEYDEVLEAYNDFAK